MYLLRQTTPSSLFIIPLWIVSMRNGFLSSTRTLRFFQPTIHPSDTTKMTSLYYFILCILINGCLRSLSSSVIHMTVLHDLPLLLPLPWMRFSVIVEKPLKVKYILCHWNPAVRTLIVNYGQFFFVPGGSHFLSKIQSLGSSNGLKRNWKQRFCKTLGWQTKSIMGVLWHFLWWSIVVIVKNRHVRLFSQQI